MKKLEFIGEDGTFKIQNPENYTGLYFPVAGEMGIKSSISPVLGGDSKINQNEFILEPTSIENLHNNESTRNFWLKVNNEKIWSVTGQSAAQINDRGSESQDESAVVAGFMWHKLVRKNAELLLEAEITSFVPYNMNAEVMEVAVTNLSDKEMKLDATAAIPIYGRSADNIRDHRHVTSLLHRIKTTDYGVLVKPTLSFDERGHKRNNVTYYACGITGKGKTPAGFYPTVEAFIGEGGAFIKPGAIYQSCKAKASGEKIAGKEAFGGIKYGTCVIKPYETINYTVILGATENEAEIGDYLLKLSTKDKVEKVLQQTIEYWKNQVNISFETGDKSFNNLTKWVSFQPILRRIYGCSFLPHHDYGKGGRGWRDLWQDCLALILMNPQSTRKMILDNFGGVRIDGTNATIIGTKPGEFIADRNNITRVWMDHGYWPLLTVKLYIEETGDLEILNQRCTYFKDKQVKRGTDTDTEWQEDGENKQKTALGEIYEGSVLEHLILQNLTAFYEVGDHNIIRLRGADWNDALDMADENGESVAFTAAYSGNLLQLAKYVRELKKKCGLVNIELASEMVELLSNDRYLNGDVSKKINTLTKYENLVKHEISGAKIKIDADILAKNLEAKANALAKTIRENEWVTDKDGDGWFNSYYDNHGHKTEGETDTGVRMILTGQVFSLMSRVANVNQAESIVSSVKKYLYDEKIGGYRINTDFHEEKYDLGRMFGFAYGEKENGAVFSHMAVMYANALYQNGFVREGYEALQALANAALNFDRSRMYPGIPEYFNNDGRGLYSYLTGAASWYIMTLRMEAFGIKGEAGNLLIEPKLVKEQFDKKGIASIQFLFRNKILRVVFENKNKKDFSEYEIKNVRVQNVTEEVNANRYILQAENIASLNEDVNQIKIILD